MDHEHTRPGLRPPLVSASSIFAYDPYTRTVTVQREDTTSTRDEGRGRRRRDGPVHRISRPTDSAASAKPGQRCYG